MIETVRNAWKVPELRKKIMFTIFALLIFRLTVNEPKFVAEMQADSKRFGIDNGDDGVTPAASGRPFASCNSR